VAKKGDMFDAKRVYLSERKKEQVSVDAQVVEALKILIQMARSSINT